MAVEILINVRPNQTRVAYVEDQELLDLKIERKTSPTLVGSIYKGRVVRILPGMQAAFVNIGLDRAAFLYAGDISTDPRTKEELLAAATEEVKEEEPLILGSGQDLSKQVPIQDLLKEGQDLLLQVAKDPLGTKGARVTTHIALPGRFLVYMPTLNHVGVSRRIEDEKERERLKKLVEKIDPQAGAIIRTVGEGATQNLLKADLDFLKRIWKDVQVNYQKRKTPGLIRSELDIELRAVRDLMTEKVDRVLVDDAKTYRKLVQFLNQFMPSYKKKVSLYRGTSPLFDLYDLDLEISRSLGRRVWLKSGGYLVIDEAEALVVVDVNTGRFVGKKDLEDTIVTTNLEAAKEIAHQLRLRNCGGIIIIDFIDMEKLAHREKVLNVLKKELEKDPSRTEIITMSELGLVEMTRKRIRPSLLSVMCDPCPYCEGAGYIKKKITVANEIFRSLEREVGRPRMNSIVVRCHSSVADWIYEEEAETLEFIEKKLGCSVAFKVEPGFHLEQHEISIL